MRLKVSNDNKLWAQREAARMYRSIRAYLSLDGCGISQVFWQLLQARELSPDGLSPVMFISLNPIVVWM